MSILVRTLVFAKDRKLNSNLLKTTTTIITEILLKQVTERLKAVLSPGIEIIMAQSLSISLFCFPLCWLPSQVVSLLIVNPGSSQLVTKKALLFPTAFWRMQTLVWLGSHVQP